MSGAGKIESGLGLQLLGGYSPRALVFAATHRLRLQLPTSDFIKSSAKTGSSAFLVKGESESVYGGTNIVSRRPRRSGRVLSKLGS